MLLVHLKVRQDQEHADLWFLSRIEAMVVLVVVFDAVGQEG